MQAEPAPATPLNSTGSSHRAASPDARKQSPKINETDE